MELSDFTSEQLKQMIEAINKTIDLHQQAIEKNVSFQEIKAITIPNGLCYLCDFDDSINAPTCFACPWRIFTLHNCNDTYLPEYAYDNNEESIIRLNEWKQSILTHIKSI